MTAERASINARLQFGKETTAGTNVSATKLVECFDMVFAVKPNVKTYRPTGRRWANTQEENEEWTEATLNGNLDYQGMVYLVSGPWGAATITTHTGGTTSKDWVWTPPTTGAITPVTYTIEQGDSVRAHKVNYGLFTGFNYKGTRDDFTCGANLIGQLLQDNITMTSSPTAVALQPVVGKQVNVYIDATSGGLGTTQYPKFLSVEYVYSGGFGPFWPLNRSNTSFASVVDLPPTNTVKFTLEADAQGMGLLTSLQSGAFLYLRVDALGGIIESAINYEMKHDMAIKLTNIDPFSDSNGIFAIGFEGTIMEDSAWTASGQSQQLTLTNLLTAL